MRAPEAARLAQQDRLERREQLDLQAVLVQQAQRGILEAQGRQVQRVQPVPLAALDRRVLQGLRVVLALRD